MRRLVRGIFDWVRSLLRGYWVMMYGFVYFMILGDWWAFGEDMDMIMLLARVGRVSLFIQTHLQRAVVQHPIRFCTRVASSFSYRSITVHLSDERMYVLMASGSIPISTCSVVATYSSSSYNDTHIP